ncbi:MAG: uncharacterized protein PWP31_2032 [Clostridia bacterium]|nr:uncharacterized protein [Clostridia bacterium]
MIKIKIKSGSYSWDGIINDTPTGHLMKQALPIKGIARRWGDEIYFPTSVNTELEPESFDVVSVGDLGYWPPGKVFCIFFGPTPASSGNEIRAASEVNIFSKIKNNLKKLNQVKDGDKIIIEKI